MFSFKFKMKIAILTVLIAVTASESELCAARIQGSRVGSEKCGEVGWGGEQGSRVERYVLSGHSSYLSRKKRIFVQTAEKIQMIAVCVN